MNKDPDRWENAFIDKLRRLAPLGAPEHWDRATLAELRRGLGKDVSYLLCRVGWLFNGVPDSDHALADAALVASLFASYPEANGSDSLGAAFRRLPESESIEKRFVALVDCARDDLPGRLRQAVSLLKAKDVALSWAELLNDLRCWDYESRRVQWKWSRAFWAEKRAEQPEAEPVIVVESSND
jgi:CRISPR system Cascade subunit CasB